MNKTKVSCSIFLILFSVSGYSSQVECRFESIIISKKINSLWFSLSIPNDIAVENIVFKKETILNRWLLQFKKSNGLVIRRNIKSTDEKLSLKEYVGVLDAALLLVSREYPVISIDEVQIDIALVDETWNQIVSLVKKEAKMMSGFIGHKNNRIHNVVSDMLLGSKQMEESCLILQRHFLKCNMRGSPINPVAFKTEYFNKEWASLLGLADAGLYEGIWFGIDLSTKDGPVLESHE